MSDASCPSPQVRTRRPAATRPRRRGSPLPAGRRGHHAADPTIFAFLIGGIVVAATGYNPISTYQGIFDEHRLNWFFPGPGEPRRADGAEFNLQQTLLVTTPLILTGLAVAFAFRCGMFNIGGQGQYFVGRSSRSGSARRGPACPASCTRCSRSCPPRSPAPLGRGSRAPEGDRRRARGDHDDHAQLDRVSGSARTPSGRRAAAERRNESVPISNDVAESVTAAVCWGEPGAQGLHIGTSSSRSRRCSSTRSSSTGRRSATRCAPSATTRSRALRRDQRRAELLPRDGDLRACSRARRRARHPRLALPPRLARHPDVGRRLHRDRRGAARAQHGDRRRPLARCCSARCSTARPREPTRASSSRARREPRR